MRSRRLITPVLLALALGGVPGCGDSQSPTREAPKAPPRAAEASPPPAAPTASAAPAGDTAASTPTPTAAETAKPAASTGPHDPAAGAALYAQNCATCHGPAGAGDGPVGAALVPKPARHDDGAYMNALSNEHLFKVIQQGGASVGKSPLMAPWGGMMSDEQIWDLVAFVRTLARPPYTGPKP